MPAPCFEPQTRDKLKIPPAIGKAFMNEVLENLKLGRSYPEALDDLASKSGLQPETINSILKRDSRVFSVTKQAIAQAGQTRMIRNAADAFAEILKTDGKIYQGPGKIAQAWDAQRRIALAGHSVVFPWTHMRNWAVQVPTEAGRARMGAFWQAATDTYRYAGERGRALYEMDMSLMQSGDYYDFLKSSGLDVVPGKRGPGDILLENRKPSWQTRNFDALKPARYTEAVRIWNNLDPFLKEGETGKVIGAMIARDINYATGSVMPPDGESANMLAKTTAQLSQMVGHYNLLLSSKLFFAKHMEGWLNPLRYLAKTGRMTPVERASANITLSRWANSVAAHIAILGVNYAFNKSMGFKTPNLGQRYKDNELSDLFRLRVGNVVVPFSPMLEALRLPIVATAAMVSGKGSAGEKAWTAIWNAAHPSFHTLYEQSTGKDFRGSPIPSIRGVIQSKGQSAYIESRKPRIGATEYLTTRGTPIAVSGAIREYYQALRDKGINASMAMAFVKSAIAGVSSGAFGTHMYEEEEKQSKSELNPNQR